MPEHSQSKPLARWRRRGSSLLARGLEPLAQQVERSAAPSKLSQGEVQEDLQRFASSFIERITQATESVSQDRSSPLHEPALRRALYCSSAALDIAAAADPEVALLDMVVFVTLCRDACREHWMRIAGEDGRELFNVLSAATAEIWSIARKLLSPAQEATLSKMIADWQVENPDQHRVEGIRFIEFSAMARDAHRIGEQSGLASRVKSVTARADQALLLGERAMFLAPRIPSLVRLHTRIGALEVLADTTAKLTQLETLLRQVSELEPLLAQTNELVGRASGLAEHAGQTIESARQLSDSALPLLQGAERLLATESTELTEAPNRVEALVRTSDALVARVQNLLEGATKLTGPDPAQAFTTLQAHITRGFERLLWKAGALGAALIALFWAGYFIVVR